MWFYALSGWVDATAPPKAYPEAYKAAQPKPSSQAKALEIYAF